MGIETFLNLDNEKRKGIIKKGVEIFTNYSYGEASTNQITKELSISKGSLFHYFESKKGFYLYLLEYCIDELTPVNHQIKSTEFYDILFESMESKMSLYTSGSKDKILFVNRASKETNEEVKDEKDKIVGKYMMKIQKDSVATLNQAIQTLNLKENENQEKLIQGMSMYINSVMTRYLAIYKDRPESFYDDTEKIKSEIKEYIDLLLYGVTKNDKNK